jgi:4'-phosphopantetheinyl transferase EntD
VIEEILPDEVSAIEARNDLSNVTLFAAEEASVGRAVEKRYREFATGRACAQMALAGLGVPAAPVTTGAQGEPQWPLGVVGSITHCEGYRACAIAHSAKIVTIGIDAECNASLPEGVLPEIARTEELPWLRDLKHDLPRVHWDRLLFSAKESVYKAWYPLAKRWLGFEEALVTVDPSTETFSARLMVSGPLLAGRRLEGFSGRWLVRDGLVLTAIALVAQSAP